MDECKPLAAAQALDDYIKDGVEAVNHRESTSSQFKAGAYINLLFSST